METAGVVDGCRFLPGVVDGEGGVVALRCRRAMDDDDG